MYCKYLEMFIVDKWWKQLVNMFQDNTVSGRLDKPTAAKWNIVTSVHARLRFSKILEQDGSIDLVTGIRLNGTDNLKVNAIQRLYSLVEYNQSFYRNI